jgi:hypothetical protein
MDHEGLSATAWRHRWPRDGSTRRVLMARREQSVNNSLPNTNRVIQGLGKQLKNQRDALPAPIC